MENQGDIVYESTKSGNPISLQLKWSNGLPFPYGLGSVFGSFDTKVETNVSSPANNSELMVT